MDKIKDINRKVVVESYQKSLRESIDSIYAKEEKLKPILKEYVSKLEENLKQAPYTLGYLELVPEDKKIKNKK